MTNQAIILGTGEWDHAVSLDKHTIKSTPIGPNEQGHMQFETERTAIGEAVFQLKYRSDFNQVDFLANAIVNALNSGYPTINLVIPMPASKIRNRQPVYEIARRAASILDIDYSEEVLVKTKSTGMMKDLATHEERVAALTGCFESRNNLADGPWDVLVIDDLYDTGASLSAACNALRTCANIRSISAIALTRRH
ncbi:ComF family protein [Pseudomonas fluorescens]|uniref:ComF family protein n=1 Tax=Pseudomonas fluorescens TaxID=294 RepID=UPI00123FE505|nr:ComF family protein [Pseudomonas fluorescens]VVP25209.1 hypothetical protein PS898_04039 [Pseudomonas fluorescens]